MFSQLLKNKSKSKSPISGHPPITEAKMIMELTGCNGRVMAGKSLNILTAEPTESLNDWREEKTVILVNSLKMNVCIESYIKCKIENLHMKEI